MICDKRAGGDHWGIEREEKHLKDYELNKTHIKKDTNFRYLLMHLEVIHLLHVTKKQNNWLLWTQIKILTNVMFKLKFKNALTEMNKEITVGTYETNNQIDNDLKYKQK